MPSTENPPDKSSGRASSSITRRQLGTRTVLEWGTSESSNTLIGLAVIGLLFVLAMIALVSAEGFAEAGRNTESTIAGVSGVALILSAIVPSVTLLPSRFGTGNRHLELGEHTLTSAMSKDPFTAARRRAQWMPEFQPVHRLDTIHRFSVSRPPYGDRAYPFELLARTTSGIEYVIANRLKEDEAESLAALAEEHLAAFKRDQAQAVQRSSDGSLEELRDAVRDGQGPVILPGPERMREQDNP